MQVNDIDIEEKPLKTLGLDLLREELTFLTLDAEAES